MALKAMVLGAGSAGEGHSIALKEAGVEVVAIASRTATVVRKVADDLGIRIASTDWRKTLAEVKPDIVAVATPGDTHVEMVETALAQGCHILIDKPLAPTSADARRIARAVKKAGVRSTYAATSCYQPSALLARNLIRYGTIGTLFEAEFVSHYRWPSRLPHGWPHRLELGGGRLNNNFTHKLAIAESVCSGVSLSIAGETRNDLRRAPKVPMPHDFRDWHKSEVSIETAEEAGWAEVDSDWSYTVLARIGAPGSDPLKAPSVTFRHSCLRKGKHQDYVAFYGSNGTIHVDEAYCQGAVHLWREGDAGFKEVPLTAEVQSWLPPPQSRSNWPKGWDIVQRSWNALAREFVRDIEGKPFEPYLTIADGWRHQEVIDAVRARSGWKEIPREP
jgi:predicted dehydrogenase